MDSIHRHVRRYSLNVDLARWDMFYIDNIIEVRRYWYILRRSDRTRPWACSLEVSSIKEFRYQMVCPSRNLLQLPEKWNVILENGFWLCKLPRIALFYLSVILLRNHDIFTWSVHQIAPFMKIIFKNFLGRRLGEPLPKRRFGEPLLIFMNGAIWCTPSKYIMITPPQNFLGLCPRFEGFAFEWTAWSAVDRFQQNFFAPNRKVWIRACVRPG